MPIAYLMLMILLSVLASGRPATAQEGLAADRPTMAFVEGLWFDGTTFTPAQRYIVEGRLTAEAPSRVDVVVDLQGRFVLPGLIDAHNHNLQNGAFGAISNQRSIRAGVYHSVQMCSRPDKRMGFAGFLNRPGSVEVLYADACLSASDGHPLGIALASAAHAGEEMSADEGRAGYDPVDSIEDLDRLWPSILERSPGLIKIILINSERRDAERRNPANFGFLGLEPAVAREIVRRAQAADIRVAAHVDSAGDFSLAVAMGVDLIAHLPGYRLAPGMGPEDYRIAQADIAEALRNGAAVITTAGAARHDMARNPENADALRSVQIDNLSRLIAAGVPLVIGSDDVMGSVIDEIVYLDALGVMPRADLLRAATEDTARIIYPGRTLGGFIEGGEATFNIYDDNPLDDLESLRSPVIGVHQGVILPHF